MERKIYAYGRLSSDEQTESNAYGSQVTRLKKAGAEEVLWDTASGNDDERREFLKLKELVKQGKVSQIIVADFDRLSRNVDTLAGAFRLFNNYKVKLHCIKHPGVDIALDSGWFMAILLGTMGDMENRIRQKRIVDGYKHLRNEKKANPSVPFGYARVNEKYARHPKNWEIAKDVIEHFKHSGSCAKSAYYMHEQHKIKFTATGFRNWLTSPILLGHTVYGRKSNKSVSPNLEIYRNTHEGLLSESDWLEIQQLIARSKSRSGKNYVPPAIDYPLAGKVFCALCGAGCYRLKGIKGMREREYMRCNRRKVGKHLCLNKFSTQLELIELEVIKTLALKAEEVANKASVPVAEDPTELKKLRADLMGLQAMRTNNRAILEAIEKLKQEIREWEQIPKPHEYHREYEEMVQAFGDPACWQNASLAQKNQVYGALVQKVLVSDGQVQEVSLVF